MNELYVHENKRVKSIGLSQTQCSLALQLPPYMFLCHCISSLTQNAILHDACNRMEREACQLIWVLPLWDVPFLTQRGHGAQDRQEKVASSSKLL